MVLQVELSIEDEEAKQRYQLISLSDKFLEDIHSMAEYCRPRMLSDDKKIQKEEEHARYAIIANNTEFQEIFKMSSADLTYLQKISSKKKAELYREIIAIIQKFIAKSSFTSLEDSVVRIQRTFRKQKRQRMEIDRVRYNYSSYMQVMKDEKNIVITPETLLQESNTPYRPQCEETLATRIQNAASKVTFFSKVRHLAATRYICSIFNDGLYSRYHLEKTATPYRKAALAQCDIWDGDLDVICFGPNLIDPRAVKMDTIELVFDVNKILEPKHRPVIFCKQRDFGYLYSKTLTLPLGAHSISIDYSYTNRQNTPNFFYGEGGWKIMASISFKPDASQYPSWKRISGEIPKPLCMVTDIDQAHQIISLLFFRFLDNLVDEEGNKETSYTKLIYDEIALLTNDELQHFLQNIFDTLTVSAEFNIVGAYKIDFSALKSITARYDLPINERYSLHLDTLISALEEGNIDFLKEAQNNIPNMFDSYRFVDYLLSKTTQIDSQQALKEIRKKCEAPEWITDDLQTQRMPQV